MDQNTIYRFIETHCVTVDTFIAPLKKLKITYLSFSRVYKNGKVIFFCNNPQWLDIKFSHKLFDYNGFFPAEKEMIENNHDKYIYSGNYDPDNRLQDFFYSHNMWNSLDIYTRHKDYVDVLHLGSTRENSQACDIYLNHIKMLEGVAKEFTTLFHDSIDLFYLKYDLSLLSFCDSQTHAETLINKELFHPYEKELLYPSQKLGLPMPVQKPSKKISLSLDKETVNISLREAQCLWFLARGRTAKQIASELNLSPRTVESYMDNIKNKTRISCRSSLVDLFHQNLLVIREILQISP